MSKNIDLTGKRFGRFEVIGYAGRDKNYNSLWQCKCDCGSLRTVRGYNLQNGTSTSCGCSKKSANTEQPVSSTRLYNIWSRMKAKAMNCNDWNDFSAFQEWALSNGYCEDASLDRINDDEEFCPENCKWLTKEQYNEKRYDLIEIDGTRKTLRGWAEHTQIPYSTLRNRWRAGDEGHDLIRPVGSIRERERQDGERDRNWHPIVRISPNGGPRNKHRASYSRLYRVWQGMKRRCNNKNSSHYKDYGGRGITVCDEWATDFQAFRNWAMQAGYDENAPSGTCTIDRIDNNKGYSPDNCRWLTIKEQANNRRNNVLYEIDGVQKTPLQWSECTGIPLHTIYSRYYRGDRGCNLIRPIAS